MCTCVLRLGCFLLICPVLYFVPSFSLQPFLMFTSEFNERSRSNPLCDFRLGTVVTSDYETPLTDSTHTNKNTSTHHTDTTHKPNTLDFQVLLYVLDKKMMIKLKT